MKLLQRRLSIRSQLLALFGLLLGTGFCVLLMDEFALQGEISTFNSLLDDSLSGLRLAKSISDSYGLQIVDTSIRVRNYLMSWDQGIKVIDMAKSDIQRDWQALLETELSPDQRVLADEIAKARERADRATDTLRGILQAQDIKALVKFSDTELYPAMDPVTTRLQFLADVKMLDAEHAVTGHLAHARAVGWGRVILSVAALIFVIIVGRGILRNVYKGIGQLVHLARHARDPAFVPPVEFEAEGSELGQINEALLAMRGDLISYEMDLLESEARATAANKAKSSFLASMSHEIRTPMVGVAGMLELLAQTRLDAEQREQLEIAQSSAQSLLQIIGDILDFSKIEAGRLELIPAPLDLRALVRASTNNFLGTASAKGLKLECRIDERVAPAHLGDALRLRQILSNFLSNALKFTEHGNVIVHLERLAAENQRELVALRVEDSGIGISGEDQARLFQPFTQAGDGGARRADSTGLGLTICRRLAELMGGEIVMQSRLGAGTTMSLLARLPLADPASLTHAETLALRPLRSAPSVAEAEREGSLILLADDHPTNRAVIARQLNQLGYACEGARDGEEALQMWQSGRFALLLTDLHMPKRDGYALAAAIRADEAALQRPRAPLIALSANVSTEEVERTRTLGIDDFMAKPTPLVLLASTLQRYLPLQRFIAPATTPPIAAVLADATLDPALIKDFLHTTQEDLLALRSALAANDATAVVHEAHRIKGASKLVGASALAGIAARIEAAGRADDLAPAGATLQELEAEVARFAAANGIAPTAAAATS
jgi:signal transduction histidine kinase/CheY-like chemotaxis protein/HPt (histidine-containing phosphotransfer) domain-containing protein